MPLFLSIEGMDGSGKSTQIELLARWLKSRGHHVTLCRDPGGPAVSEQIRALLLNPDSTMSMRTEMLLYLAARSELIEEIIKPSLAKGHIVLCDRFLLSTIVYQGHAGGLDAEMIRAVGTAAAGNLLPDWVGILDMPPEISATRRQGPADRIEQRPLDYYINVRAGYLAEAKRDPDRLFVFDATRSPNDVHHALREELERGLQKIER